MDSTPQYSNKRNNGDNNYKINAEDRCGKRTQADTKYTRLESV
jgi:hypothetical protein